MLKIKEIRESLGYTQDDVASKTGISKRSYVNYENNLTDIPLSKLQDIATFFNMEISELIVNTKNANNVTKENSNINSNINKEKRNINEMLLNDGSLEDIIVKRVLQRLTPLLNKLSTIDEYIETTNLLEGLVGKMILEKDGTKSKIESPEDESKGY